MYVKLCARLIDKTSNYQIQILPERAILAKISIFINVVKNNENTIKKYSLLKQRK